MKDKSVHVGPKPQTQGVRSIDAQKLAYWNDIGFMEALLAS